MSESNQEVPAWFRDLALSAFAGRGGSGRGGGRMGGRGGGGSACRFGARDIRAGTSSGIGRCNWTGPAARTEPSRQDLVWNLRADSRRRARRAAPLPETPVVGVAALGEQSHYLRRLAPVSPLLLQSHEYLHPEHSIQRSILTASEPWLYIRNAKVDRRYEPLEVLTWANLHRSPRSQ